MLPVNMNTLRLEVSRGRDESLITKDRMRVDVVAELYVRVQAAPDAIANAAQTLGHRTMQPDSLKESVRPMERIESIKILHVDGLGGGGGNSQASDCSSRVWFSLRSLRSSAP